MGETREKEGRCDASVYALVRVQGDDVMARSFWAVGEDGRRLAIVIYTQYADLATGDSRTREKAVSAAMYATDYGVTVKRLDKGTYQIGKTGEILRSNDPDAP